MQMGWCTRRSKGGFTIPEFGKGPAAADAEDTKTMRAEKESVQEMRLKSINTLHLVLLLHLDEELRLACMRMMFVALPIQNWLQDLMETLIDRQGCKAYLMGMSTGSGILKSIRDVAGVLSDMAKLTSLDFLTERLTSTEYYRNLTLDSPEVSAEEEKAFKLGQLISTVMAQRWKTASEFFYGYPNMLYRYCMDDVHHPVVTQVQRKMALLWKGLHCVCSTTLCTTPFWKKVLTESQLNWVYVRDVFEYCAGLGFSAAAVPRVKAAAEQDSMGFGNTALVEHAFRDVRDLQRDNKNENLAPLTIWRTVTEGKLLSETCAYASVDVDRRQPLRPQEADRMISRRMFLPDFKEKTVDFGVIVSKSRAAPYVSPKPENMCEMGEFNELVCSLTEGPDDTLQDRLAMGPASWRSRFVPRGAIVKDQGDETQYYTGSGTWVTRLWPVERRKGPVAEYYVLKDEMYVSGLETKPLLAFSQISVMRAQTICPALWFVLNGNLPSCSVVPQDAIMVQMPGIEFVSLLVWLANTGWRGFIQDDLAILCNLELNIQEKVQGKGLERMQWHATQTVLEVSDEETSAILTACLQGGEGEGDLIATLNSEAAKDVIDKSDQKTIQTMSDAWEQERRDRRRLTKLIRERSGGSTSSSSTSGGGRSAYLGDKLVSQEDAAALLPAPRSQSSEPLTQTCSCYARKC